MLINTSLVQYAHFPLHCRLALAPVVCRACLASGVSLRTMYRQLADSGPCVMIVEAKVGECAEVSTDS